MGLKEGLCRVHMLQIGMLDLRLRSFFEGAFCLTGSEYAARQRQLKEDHSTSPT